MVLVNDVDAPVAAQLPGTAWHVDCIAVHASGHAFLRADDPAAARKRTVVPIGIALAHDLAVVPELVTLTARNSPTRARSTVLLGEVFRFGFVGALSYGLGIALAAMFHEVFDVPEKGAVGASLAIVLVTNFFLARTFIFRSAGDVRHELARFAVTSATMRGIEYTLFVVLLNYAGIGYLIAMTVAMATSTVAKFFIYRTLVFRTALRRP